MSKDKEPRLRIIDLTEFEKEYDFELNRTGMDSYTQGYQRAIRNIHESLLNSQKTKKILGWVYDVGEESFVADNKENYKREYINNLIKE